MAATSQSSSHSVALYSKQIVRVTAIVPRIRVGSYVGGPAIRATLDDQKTRRSGRVTLAVPIELVGTDVYGQEFWEETQTAVVSRYGAAVISKRKLTPQQEMTIRRLDTNKEAEIRIVAKVSEEKDGYVYGVGFTNSEHDFWGVEIPDAPRLQNDAHSVTLMCCSCRTCESVQAGEIALGILDEEQGVSRFCKRCQTSTRWKQAEDTATSPQPESSRQPASPDTSSQTPAKRRNARKDVRAKVNARGCVRIGNFSDEVTCRDMSRGGVCFDSRKRYAPGEEIQIAVPFTPGNENLFVSARIAYARELPDQKVFRHGAAYLRNSRATSPL